MKNLNKVLSYGICMLLCIVLSQNLGAQEKVNEKQAINKKHINFSKEVLYFNLSGLIEIDGHTFMNDTCKCPILYIANLEKITIIDTCKNIRYLTRKCARTGCEVIHLIQKSTTSGTIIVPDDMYWHGGGGSYLNLN